MEATFEIFLVPFFSQGHMIPFIELCKKLCSMQQKTTLIISSDLLPNVPTLLLQQETFSIAEFPTPLPPPPPTKPDKSATGPSPLVVFFQQMGKYIESLLSTREAQNPGQTRPAFAVVDDMMLWSKGSFMKFKIPVVAFFTCAAVDSAMAYAAWKNDVENLSPGERRYLTGLPEEMAFKYSDLTIRKNSKANQPEASIKPPGPRTKSKSFPTEPGDEPLWLDGTKGSVAFLFNTCDELERPFLNYISTQLGLPVWGIGPLLPDVCLKRGNVNFRDSEVRSNRPSNYSEEQVVQWLDSKSVRSVIYISFGSQVAPKLEEHEEIGKALEELDRPFIWVLQTGPDAAVEYYPHGLDSKVGRRGLIIHGWAPQLLILNHPSIGGCLTHCGWNSTVEAIACGIPLLAWPIRGDQYYNAKSIESHLKVGYVISHRDDESEIVTKETIVKGIKKLLDDEEVHKQAEALRVRVFGEGFPGSSIAALNVFIDFMSQVSP